MELETDTKVGWYPEPPCTFHPALAIYFLLILHVLFIYSKMHSLSFDRCIYPYNKDIEHFHSKGTSSLCDQSPPQSQTSTHLMPIAVGWFCLLECHRNILLNTTKFLIFIHVVACISGSEFFSLGIFNRVILCLGDYPMYVGYSVASLTAIH